MAPVEEGEVRDPQRSQEQAPVEIGLDGTLERCPECSGTDLRCVTDGELVHFFCDSCAACWHLELGWLQRVQPATCPGCALRFRCDEREARAAGAEDAAFR